jgi:hypothetical protein
MATRRYSIQPGDRLQDVTEAVGVATVTKMFEFTVDLSALAAVAGLSAGQGKEQVLIALRQIEDWIVQGGNVSGSGIWPPA